MAQWDELERLHGLHSAGVLTDEEYAREKAKLLSSDTTEERELPPPRKSSSRAWLAAVAAAFVVAIAVALLIYGKPDRQNPSLSGAERAPAPIESKVANVSADETHPGSPPGATIVASDWRPAPDPRSEGLDLAMPNDDDQEFKKYPARLMTGTFHKPVDHQGYRTALEEAEKEGVTFAGRYAVATIGCGMGCTFSFAIDGETGKVIDMPFGGEEFGQGAVFYSPVSTLLQGYWNADERQMCDYAAYTLNAGSFHRLHGEPNRRPCPKSLSSTDLAG